MLISHGSLSLIMMAVQSVPNVASFYMTAVRGARCVQHIRGMPVCTRLRRHVGEGIGEVDPRGNRDLFRARAGLYTSRQQFTLSCPLAQ